VLLELEYYNCKCLYPSNGSKLALLLISLIPLYRNKTESSESNNNIGRFVVLNSGAGDWNRLGKYAVTTGKYTDIWVEGYFGMLDPVDEGNALSLDLINYVYFPVVMT
jgi:hypothetical protein